MILQLIEKEKENLELALQSLIEHEADLEKLKNDIVHTIKNKGKIIFTGIGKNVYACQKLAASFSSIGIPSFFMDAVHAVHGDIGVVSNNDLLICMSKSGNTSELVNTLLHIHSNKERFKFKTIGIDCNITGNENGFDKYCDYSLHINSHNEIDPMNIVPTVSAIVLQLIGDVVGVAAAIELGFDNEVFRYNHPGGTIGIQLKK